MAKGKGGKGFGLGHGGGNISNRLVVSAMSPKMAPKGGKMGGHKK